MSKAQVPPKLNLSMPLSWAEVETAMFHGGLLVTQDDEGTLTFYHNTSLIEIRRIQDVVSFQLSAGVVRLYLAKLTELP